MPKSKKIDTIEQFCEALDLTTLHHVPSSRINKETYIFRNTRRDLDAIFILTDERIEVIAYDLQETIINSAWNKPLSEILQLVYAKIVRYYTRNITDFRRKTIRVRQLSRGGRRSRKTDTDKEDYSRQDKYYKKMINRETYSMAGKELRILREMQGLSIREFCQSLGVSFASVSHWENGRKKPNLENIEKLAIFYDLPRSEIVSWYVDCEKGQEK